MERNVVVSTCEPEPAAPNPRLRCSCDILLVRLLYRLIPGWSVKDKTSDRNPNFTGTTRTPDRDTSHQKSMLQRFGMVDKGGWHPLLGTGRRICRSRRSSYTQSSIVFSPPPGLHDTSAAPGEAQGCRVSLGSDSVPALTVRGPTTARGCPADHCPRADADTVSYPDPTLFPAPSIRCRSMQTYSPAAGTYTRSLPTADLV